MILSAGYLMEENLVAAEYLMEENLVAAEPSICNIAKKWPVLPPSIERHSEDVVLRMRRMMLMRMMMMRRMMMIIMGMMLTTMMMMMLTMMRIQLFLCPQLFNRTTLRPSLKLLGYIKVDSLSI